MVAPSSAWGETNTADAFGGTNIIPLGGVRTANQGVMFYLKNHRPIGQANYIKGAVRLPLIHCSHILEGHRLTLTQGLALVTLSGTKNVTTTRLSEYVWDAVAGEPQYGDVGAYTDGTYIFGYGHGSTSATQLYTYLTRNLLTTWSNTSKWEYFNGSSNTWSTTRLYNPAPSVALQWNPADGSAWAIDQGQMIWSAYYGCIIWVYTIDWSDNGAGLYSVYARTAKTPQGPWTAAVKLYSVQAATAGGLVYCAIANPYYDASGKSIVVTVANGANVIQATKVVFK